MKQYPLLCALVFFGSGIAIAEVFPSWLWPFWLAIASLGILLVVWMLKPDLSTPCLLLAILVFGFGRMQLQLRGYYLFVESFGRVAVDGKITAQVWGVIHEVREHSWGSVLLVVLEKHSLPLALPKKVKLEVSIKGGDYAPGMRVELSGSFALPPRARNPTERSWRRHLARDSCYLTGEARKIQVVGQRFFWGKALARKLAAPWRGLPEAERGLLEAVILGQRQGLNTDVAHGFSALGLAHLLSVSGLHVGFVRILCASFASPPLTIILMFLYTLAVGWKPPAIRALVMLSLDLVAKLLGLRTEGLNSLGLSGLLLLLFNPLLLLDPGFLLSFLATLSILAYNQLSLSTKGLLKLLGISLAAQLGTLPLVAHFFNQVVPLSPLANLLFGAALGLLVQGGLLSGLLALVARPLGEALAWGLYPIARLVNALASFLGKLPWGVLQVRCLALWEFALYYLLIVVVYRIWQGALSWPHGLAGVGRGAKIREAGRRTISLLLVALFLWQGLPLVGSVFNPRLQVTIFDVGQGDSILIRTPRGKFILVDGGPSSVQVDRLLAKLGVGKLSLAVLTHKHADHARGFWPAIAKRDPTYLWTDDEPPVGRRLKLAGAAVELLGGGRGLDPNLRSLIVLVRFRGFGVLLTGDAPIAMVEAAIAGRDLPPLLYKVPHHGAAGSTSARLFELCSPIAACISCGEGNRYGHPAETTIEQLQRAGIPIARTDTQGCLTYSFSARGMKRRVFIWEKGLW